MPGRKEQKLETRRRLVETAMRVFAADGIGAARTSDIAGACGVSHGTVFVHFPTREELVAAVIRELFTRIVGRIHGLAVVSADLREILEAHVEAIAEYEELYTRLVIEGSMLGPYPRSLLIGIQSGISYHMTDAVRREVANGSIREMPQHL